MKIRDQTRAKIGSNVGLTWRMIVMKWSWRMRMINMENGCELPH